MFQTKKEPGHMPRFQSDDVWNLARQTVEQSFDKPYSDPENKTSYYNADNIFCHSFVIKFIHDKPPLVTLM